MSEDSQQMMRSAQCARIILCICEMYGVAIDEATDKGLVPEDFDLDSTTEIIDLINDYGKNRGKYQKGSNKNPITGTGGKTKKPAEEPEETETDETKD